ncbi:hypothetical protein [Streptomyces sp. JNUCC 63]
MTPWLRVLLRATGLLIVLGAAILSGGSAAAYDAVSTPSDATASSHGHSASVPASPSAGPPRHGSRPGVGRGRPGRPHRRETKAGSDDTTGPGEDDGSKDPGSASGSPEVTPASTSPQQAAPVTSGPPDSPAPVPVPRPGPETGPMLRILPLGSGLVLIGLGLGLAFIALRLRRD